MGGELTQNQEEIMEMYVVKGMIPEQIANARQISIQAVYKTLRKLRKKGWLEYNKNRGFKKSDAYHQRGLKNFFRLHNIHLVIEPYHFYERFKENIHKIYPIGIYTITINTKNIEAQTQKLKSYDEQSINECWVSFAEDMETMIRKLENDVGCEIWKNRKMNIKLVNYHLAEVHNGVATQIMPQKLKIIDLEGKVWLVIDKSTGAPEMETVDPVLARDDMEMLQTYYNDLRQNRPPTNSELAEQIQILTEPVKSFEQLAEEIKTKQDAMRNKHHLEKLNDDEKFEMMKLLKKRIFGV